MKHVISFISRIINIGVTNEDYTIDKNTKVTNLFALSVIMATIFFFIFDFIIRDTKVVLISHAIFCFTFIFVIYLNSINRRNFSRILSVIAGFSVIYILTLFNGNQSSIPLYFTYGITLAFLIFSRKEVWKIFCTFLVLITLFFISDVYLSADVALYPLDDTTMIMVHKILNSLVAMILLIVAITHFNHDVKVTTSLLNSEVKTYNYLLDNIYPRTISEKLKENSLNHLDIAKDINNCSVLYADIVDFTKFSKGMKADDLVQLLNKLFTMFDTDICNNDTEKIKTIGDAYIIASGVPFYNVDHEEKIVLTAKSMLESLEIFNRKFNLNLKLRIGIGTGSVIAGVIGESKLAYDIMGEALDIAQQLESECETNRIHVSNEIYEKLTYKYYDFDKNPNTANTYYFKS